MNLQNRLDHVCSLIIQIIIQIVKRGQIQILQHRPCQQQKIQFRLEIEVEFIEDHEYQILEDQLEFEEETRSEFEHQLRQNLDRPL